MICLILFNPTIDRIIEIPNFQPNGTYKINKEYLFPLGKAISVGLTIRELDKNIKLNLISFIGKNEIKIYQEFLNSKNITNYLIPVEGKTRSNITIIDNLKETTTHIRFPGFEVNESNLSEMKNKILNLIRNDDYIIISGSFPNGMACDFIYKELTPIIHKRNAKLVIDTSGEPLNYIVDSKPHFIKLNIVETNQILKKNLVDSEELNNPPTNDFLKRISNEIKYCDKIIEAFNHGLKFYILTLGKYGSLYISNDEIIYSYLNIEKSYYNVGCGDSFLGGLVYGLTNNHNIIDCLKIATSCGAANTQTIGAGILKKEHVFNFFNHVNIIKIN